MSCAPGIYSKLPMTSPPEGSWFYVGYSTTAGGPFTGTPAVPLVNVPPNTSLQTWGYDFVLYNEGKTPGYYRFTYTYPGGVDNVTIQIQSDAVCAGANGALTIEEGFAGSINLIVLISGGACPSPASGGTWENLDSAPGFNAATGDLNYGLLSEGQYQFKYTIAGADELGCDTCSTSAIATVIVESPSVLAATISSVTESCLYTYKLINPSTSVENSVHFTIADNDTNATQSYILRVENCDGGTVSEETLTVPAPSRVGTEIFTPAMSTGGWIDFFRLRSTLGVDINVPVAPLTATYAGVGGTTNATQLTYNAATPSVFYTALRIATVNYLGSLGYVENVDYGIVKMGQYSGNQVSIVFASKRNPSSRWIGLRKADAYMESRPTGGAVSTTSTAAPYSPGYAFSRNASPVPCLAGVNSLYINVSSAATHINTTTLDYNVLSLTSANIAVTPTGTLSRTCSDKRLTAVPTGCGGSLSYSWSNGSTTDNIIVPNLSGAIHEVTVSCTSPASSVEKSITL